MKSQNGTIRLSASDLSNHLACHHLTAINLQVARGKRSAPAWHNPDLWVLQQRGFAHEESYLKFLRDSGLSIADLREIESEQEASEATIAAMAQGVDVIAQATMLSSGWIGRADVLRKMQTTSRLGPWSYEVYDCKLARETKAATILQLSLYSDLLESIQGLLPQCMHVIAPGRNFDSDSYRVQDFGAYYRYVKSKLEQSVASDTFDHSTYPEPNPHCDICAAWQECDGVWRRDDHLSLVAGITKLQRKQFLEWDVSTLERLARLSLPLEVRPEHGAKESYVRVREQARVQVESRGREVPSFELLEAAPSQGLAKLPEPDPGDIFFDLESDPFAGERGIEYLFGFVAVDTKGAPVYQHRWAHTADEERAAFEWFIDVVMLAWAENPGMHIYHYTPYEPSAVKRLMGKYATREDAVDRLLRGSVFVDLHAVFRQAFRAGVEQYSLKRLEPLYAFKRDVPLEEARSARRAVEHALELDSSAELDESVLDTTFRYNRDDCLSTRELRDWLEEQRRGAIDRGYVIARPHLQDGAPAPALDERQQRVAAIQLRLIDGIPANANERSEEQAARRLLANLLDWHRREDKAEWWEFFRLAELPEEDLLNEKAALSGLRLIERIAIERKLPVDRYQFDLQECGIHAEDPLFTGYDRLGTTVAIDGTACTIDIKKAKKTVELHPRSVFTFSAMNSRELAESLYRLGEWIVEHGLDSAGPYRAARDLLLRRLPRINNHDRGELIHINETTLAAAKRIVASLDSSVLAIQGPPGAGKTYIGARMICELLSRGRKVGITSASHKVIRHMLDEVGEAAAEIGFSVKCVQKVAERTAAEHSFIKEVTDNAAVLKSIQEDECHLLAGTAWMWARPEFYEAVDVLFVDEAGQMSLANVLAVAPAARNLVLLGDPQQLEQPLCSTHPEGSNVSALEHHLAKGKTIQPEKGLFLAHTWRLHPEICRFTSELFYEGRLQSASGLERQRIVGLTSLCENGLCFIPVNHCGNQNVSSEEVAVVAGVVNSLLQTQVQWIDHRGQARPLTLSDILIVAPYNAQVFELISRLPGARIGTVDKFQGQESPIVIYSLTTSSPQEAPRGMEFLYSLNRLNVATSRARALCVLVGSLSLFEPECRSPRQMRLANALCRYLELASIESKGFADELKSFSRSAS